MYFCNVSFNKIDAWLFQRYCKLEEEKSGLEENFVLFYNLLRKSRYYTWPALCSTETQKYGTHLSIACLFSRRDLYFCVIFRRQASARSGGCVGYSVIYDKNLSRINQKRYILWNKTPGGLTITWFFGRLSLWWMISVCTFGICKYAFQIDGQEPEVKYRTFSSAGPLRDYL